MTHRCVLGGELFKLEVDLAVKMLAQEDGPETEERVHLARHAKTKALALLEGVGPVLVVLVLDKVVLLEDRARRVLQRTERRRRGRVNRRNRRRALPRRRGGARSRIV